MCGFCRTFVSCREVLARASPNDFVDRQFADTAGLSGCSRQEVENIVSEWIDRRPLYYLAECRYPGIEQVFIGLHRSGRITAVLSDYSAQDKIAALGLDADVVVSATDEDVQALKPDPTGLVKVLRVTGVTAERAVMVGSRVDRDQAMASRVGMDAIIRCRHPDTRCTTFRTYNDPLFKPLLRSL